VARWLRWNNYKDSILVRRVVGIYSYGEVDVAVLVASSTNIDNKDKIDYRHEVDWETICELWFCR